MSLQRELGPGLGLRHNLAHPVGQCRVPSCCIISQVCHAVESFFLCVQRIWAHPLLHTAAENLPITECNEMLVYSVALTVSGARVAGDGRVIGVRLVENACVLVHHWGVAIGNVSEHEGHSMQYLGTGNRKFKCDAQNLFYLAQHQLLRAGGCMLLMHIHLGPAFAHTVNGEYAFTENESKGRRRKLETETQTERECVCV